MIDSDNIKCGTLTKKALQDAFELIKHLDEMPKYYITELELERILADENLHRDY